MPPPKERPEPAPMNPVGADLVESLKELWELRTVQRIAGEGLRDRKKRILRQQISDTATLMFLQRGFDEVRVAEIAEACGVSEKTVFNYFPTKESLLFDREADLADELADAFSDRTTERSLTEIALAILERDVQQMYDSWAAADEPDAAMVVIRQFSELIERTPALGAAQHGMMERLTQVTATALADRAGVAPDDPEPQMAAAILMGLWRIQFRAMRRHSDGTRSFADVRDSVIADTRRAARLADSGLSSFDLVVRRGGTSSDPGSGALGQRSAAAGHRRREAGALRVEAGGPRGAGASHGRHQGAARPRPARRSPGTPRGDPPAPGNATPHRPATTPGATLPGPQAITAADERDSAVSGTRRQRFPTVGTA